MPNVYELRFDNALHIAERVVEMMRAGKIVTWADRQINKVEIQTSTVDQTSPPYITFLLQREEGDPIESAGLIYFYDWESSPLLTIEEFNARARLNLCVWQPVHGFHSLLGLEVKEATP